MEKLQTANNKQQTIKDKLLKKNIREVKSFRRKNHILSNVCVCAYTYKELHAFGGLSELNETFRPEIALTTV